MREENMNLFSSYLSPEKYLSYNSFIYCIHISKILVKKKYQKWSEFLSFEFYLKMYSSSPVIISRRILEAFYFTNQDIMLKIEYFMLIQILKQYQMQKIMGKIASLLWYHNGVISNIFSRRSMYFDFFYSISIIW